MRLYQATVRCTYAREGDGETVEVDRTFILEAASIRALPKAAATLAEDTASIGECWYDFAFLRGHRLALPLELPAQGDKS